VLQSLVVRKTSRGKYAIIAGRRRYLALSALAEGGTITADAPVPCRIVPGSADATEISLTENVMRTPMHPADQFDAFRELIDNGSTVADIAARFGMAETAVKQRLRLARVSPVVFEAYRNGELSLDQVQAFAVSDDAAAQEKLFGELDGRRSDPRSIRSALTQDEIPGTDKRARFVTLAAYEEAGGTLRRDLFAESDEGVFILDAALLDRLAMESLMRKPKRLRPRAGNGLRRFLNSTTRHVATSGCGDPSPCRSPRKQPPRRNGFPRSIRPCSTAWRTATRRLPSALTPSRPASRSFRRRNAPIPRMCLPSAEPSSP